MDGKELGAMPAYAHTRTKQLDRGHNGYEYKDVIAGGLTLRQHFAGLALQGLLTNDPNGPLHAFAAHAVRHADALLAELSKDPN